MASEFSRKLLIKHEGVRDRCYDDGDGLPVVPGKTMIGHPTIGVGRCLDTKGLNPREINEVFNNDLLDAEEIVRTIFGYEIFQESDRRIAALLSMAHNLGKGGLLRFIKMIDAIKRRNWNEAANEAQNSLWYNQTGNRGKEIVQLLKEG